MQYFDVNQSVDIEAGKPFARSDISKPPSMYINPFTYFLQTAEGKWINAMGFSSKNALIRMGPTVILLHEFQHTEELSWEQNVALPEMQTTVPMVNRLIDFHPSIARRTGYKIQRGQRFTDLANPLFLGKEWVDIPTVNELLTGITKTPRLRK